MNNWQALQQFWEGFDIDAYDEQTAFTHGTSPAYPHLTYESVSGTWESRRTLSASLWYRSTSWRDIKEKADMIKSQIGAGRTVPVDDGIIWFRIPEYTPFAQVVDSGDDNIRRILLNIEVEFLTI